MFFTVSFSRLIKAKNFEVRFGMHVQKTYKNDAEQTRSVRKIKIHEDYDPNSVVCSIFCIMATYT
jgi:hypothetical protein